PRPRVPALRVRRGPRPQRGSQHSPAGAQPSGRRERWLRRRTEKPPPRALAQVGELSLAPFHVPTVAPSSLCLLATPALSARVACSARIAPSPRSCSTIVFSPRSCPTPRASTASTATAARSATDELLDYPALLDSVHGRPARPSRGHDPARACRAGQPL